MAISAASADALPPARTRAQRRAAGKALRRALPRSEHARWTPAADRPDPIDLLEASNRIRVPELVPVRMARMAASPFGFLRGAAGIMATDLSTSRVTGLRVQLCGDAHVGNFGIFATLERDRVFDANDFDETLPGPFEWDIKRLATSLVLAGRAGRLPERTSRRAARAAVGAYRARIAQLAATTYQSTWYSHIDAEALPGPVDRSGRSEIERAMRRARRRTGLYAFPRLATRVRGRFRMRDDPPTIAHYDAPAAVRDSRRFFEQYRRTLPPERRLLLDRYRLQDVARKVVGVGSVGTVCSVLLLLADDDPSDPLFLQLKEAVPSVWEPFAGASRYSNHAERVVVGQRMVQESSDVFLGWGTLDGRDFYVRQLRDMKFSVDLARMGPKAFIGHAELCGAALARAHARTGDPSALAGYLGAKPAFDDAVERFAVAYAAQTEADHAALRTAIRQGRVAAAAA